MQSPRNFDTPPGKEPISIRRSIMSSGIKGKELAHSARQIKQAAKTETNWMKPMKTRPDAG